MAVAFALILLMCLYAQQGTERLFALPPGSQPAGESHLKEFLIRSASLGFGLLAFLISVKKNPDDSRPNVLVRLGAVLVIDVGIMLFYGGLYEALYRDDPKNFLFASDVTQSETDRFVSSAEPTLRSLQQQRDGVTVLLARLAGASRASRTPARHSGNGPCVAPEVPTVH
jgi:hypothetical protein